MLRAARELLAVRSPLDAELMVSELLGTWWGHRPRVAAGGNTDVEILVGEGLVEYAARQQTPAALALLSGIACLGTPRQAASAEKAALAFMDSGVPRPAWAEHVGAVAADACYLNSDLFGDRDEVICLFSYAGKEPHALVTVVDYNTGGMLRDGWVTSQVDTLLERCRAASEAVASSRADGGGPAQGSFRPIDGSHARRLLETALEVTDGRADPPVSDSFASYHAFIRARIRTLPPAAGERKAGHARARAAGTGGAGQQARATRWETAGARRQAWSRDRRAMLVAEFLASDEAEDLSDRSAASRCADHIIDYGCDRDFGRPLRMSPAKAETFLLDWLPRKVMLTPAEQHSMPHVLASWVRWTGRRRGLAPSAVAATLDAVFDSMGTFTKVYRDPSAFGLDADLVARLLPDADLEALPRRAFAFPVLQGRYRGVDLTTLDPSRPADRRLLLAADHSDANGKGTSRQHLERHLALADRLWTGDPPELWEAAQRLLDQGQDRHAVQHTLMYLLRDADGDAEGFAAALRELPHEPPPRTTAGS
ncbi:MAG: hypothetical protein J2P33_06630 [Actinobacteria bacterium]|nr:hypothetical protein [Actinomycetota bacterium]